MRELGKRTIQISIALGAIVGLIGCGGDQASDVESGSARLRLHHHQRPRQPSTASSAVNGLTAANGLDRNGFARNGFASVNGLAAINGLATSNGLPTTNGLMTTSAGRKTVSYMVKCALASNDSLVKQDQNGNNYTFAGGIGLCPTWKNGGVAGNAQCIESDLRLHDGPRQHRRRPRPASGSTRTTRAIGWGVDRVNYPMQEGTFFGDIIDTGPLTSLGKPNVDGPVAYYCDGAGFPAGASGVGRRPPRRQPARARPTANPFGNGTLCQNANAAASGSTATGAAGAARPARSPTRKAAAPTATRRSPPSERRRLAARHHRLAQHELHAHLRPRLTSTRCRRWARRPMSSTPSRAT